MIIFLKDCANYLSKESDTMINAPILSSILIIFGVLIGCLIAKWRYGKLVEVLKEKQSNLELQAKLNLSESCDSKELEYKRNLIAKWRNMVNEVIKEKDENKNNIKAAVYLERHKDYYDLEPHLSEDTLCQLCRATEFTLGSTISPPLQFILNDIARLEKEWKLL